MDGDGQRKRFHPWVLRKSGLHSPRAGAKETGLDYVRLLVPPLVPGLLCGDFCPSKDFMKDARENPTNPKSPQATSPTPLGTAVTRRIGSPVPSRCPG